MHPVAAVLLLPVISALNLPAVDRAAANQLHRRHDYDYHAETGCDLVDPAHASEECQLITSVKTIVSDTMAHAEGTPLPAEPEPEPTTTTTQQNTLRVTQTRTATATGVPTDATAPPATEAPEPVPTTDEPEFTILPIPDDEEVTSIEDPAIYFPTETVVVADPEETPAEGDEEGAEEGEEDGEEDDEEYGEEDGEEDGEEGGAVGTGVPIPTETHVPSPTAPHNVSVTYTPPPFTGAAAAKGWRPGFVELGSLMLAVLAL